MLSDICFEQIQNNYWFGAYGAFKLVLMKDCGWVNATKLCNDGGKLFKNWIRLDNTKELIKAVQNENGYQSEVIKYVQTENIQEKDRNISGTYCHPYLIPHLATWISAEFALKVSKIINTYMVREYQEKIAITEKEKQSLLTALLTRNEEKAALEGDLHLALQDLRNKADRLIQVEMALQQAKQVKEVADRAIEILIQEKQTAQNETQFLLQKGNQEIKRWSQENALAVIHKNNMDEYPYYALRTQNRKIKKSLRRLQQRYPNLTLIFMTNYIPNGINLYHQLRHLTGVQAYCNHFKLTVLSEEELKVSLLKMCDLRFKCNSSAPIYIDLTV